VVAYPEIGWVIDHHARRVKRHDPGHRHLERCGMSMSAYKHGPLDTMRATEEQMRTLPPCKFCVNTVNRHHQ
jgi:hypothetical protein